MVNKYIFAFKDKSEGRDCVAYFDLKDLRSRHVCVDGKFNIHGPCFCMSFNDRFPYENSITILTRDEFMMMQNGQVTDEIISKLLENENQELFAKVIEEEKEALMNEYDLDEDDIERIFDEYYLDYRDRGMVGHIYDNSDDLGYETAQSLGYMGDDNISSTYFDYERFGADLLSEENCVELSDGRVAYLNY